jgi:hypothetical protein
MDKTGFVDKIAHNLERGWEAYQLASSSREALARNLVLAESLSLLKEIKSTEDIILILGIEEMMLRQELALYANSQEQHSSITAALDQIQEAKSSFIIVQDAGKYQAAAATYAKKQKAQGLPEDSFRIFLNSHSTRLNNRMASVLPVPEKDILQQRKENLSAVKELYIAMQRNALGIPEAETGKGLKK